MDQLNIFLLITAVVITVIAMILSRLGNSSPICAVLGVDPSFAATLMIIGTICDIPATLLNATGNLVASTLVQRLAGK